MSSTFFPASADSVSASNGLECEPSRSARSIRSAAASSLSTGPMSPVTTTLEPSPPIDYEQTEFPWMPSAEDFPVKTSPEPTVFGVAAQGFKDRALAFGQNTPGSFANYDLASSSWKMLQTSLIGLETFSETWPRSGMTRNGTAFKRLSLGAVAPEKGSGWFRTPVSSDWMGSTGKGSRRGTLPESLMLSPGPHHIPLRQKTGFPNPPFLEWLMGLPIGWTALDEPKPSATPSSRKSRKSSGEQS